MVEKVGLLRCCAEDDVQWRIWRAMNFLRQTFNLTKSIAGEAISSFLQRSTMATLNQMHRTGPHFKVRPPRQPLDGKPFAKGVVLKTLIKKPKKPNSANRKCVLVRLSTGKELVAYIPGIGHNLQEHNIVLVRVGRCQDLPGVKIKCVRGKYDLPHVIKQK
ncbi:40S ribosomal protein S12, mitochondrial isoform X1 [Anopheles arabiensis]|uniref:40S ribosomal protein S12, mitochondrial isoform X1 n=1 Tax=Anopheles arabiensis TaxID=7173 RepID=UPI001AAE1095|nr:40S ribosomal protein S12, mitochondrial isoform X1 [Anopheles arabiensis]